MTSRDKLWPCSNGSLSWKSRTPPSWTGEWLQEGMLVARLCCVKGLRKENKDANWETSSLYFLAVPCSLLCCLLFFLIDKGLFAYWNPCRKKMMENCGWCSEELTKLYVMSYSVCKGKWVAFPDHFIWKGNVTKQNVPSTHLGMGKGVEALRTVIWLLKGPGCRDGGGKGCLQFWWQSTARLWEEQSVYGVRCLFETWGCLNHCPPVGVNMWWGNEFVCQS